MTVKLICIGTELLSGKINTHGAYISKALQTIGLFLSEEQTLPDSLPIISTAIQESLSKTNVLIICGGLGPTFDDITREAVSNALKTKLVFNTNLFDRIRKIMRIYKKKPSRFEKKQAYVIRGAAPLPNTAGVAPGQIIKHRNNYIILLPGPFNELRPMFEKKVIPFLKKNIPREKTQSIQLKIIGMFEAEVDKKIRPLIKKYSFSHKHRVRFSIIADSYIITLTVTACGNQQTALKKVLAQIKNKLCRYFGDAVFSTDYSTLEEVIACRLKKSKRTVSIAESCTGGLVSGRLTSLPGSSLFFKQGLIVYSNESKIKIADVPEQLLKRHGAVSKAVAQTMAEKIRQHARTYYGMSITGIAGPGGATAHKEVGLVYIGIAEPNKTRVEEFHFKGDRSRVRNHSVIKALDILRKQLTP